MSRIMTLTGVEDNRLLILLTGSKVQTEEMEIESP